MGNDCCCAMDKKDQLDQFNFQSFEERKPTRSEYRMYGEDSSETPFYGNHSTTEHFPAKEVAKKYPAMFKYSPEGLATLQLLSSLKGGVDELRQTNGNPVIGPFLYTQNNQRLTYKGQFHKGLRHGYGCSISHDGIGYKGNWENDFRSGFGQLVEPNGDYIVCIFRNGNPNGQGKMYASETGERYEGVIVLGKRHGMGTLSKNDGSVFQGEWKNEKLNGNGFWKKGGDSYEGTFLNSEFHGKGTFNGKDGTNYTGEFVRGGYHGKGILKLPTGEVYDCKFVEGLPEGEGTLFYPDGNKYIGRFIQGLPEGEGALIDKKGLSRTGTWKQGSRVG